MATSPNLSAQPGDRLIDLGGRRLAVNVSGQGAPTVILETGLGAESAEWAPVQREIETFARVFRYDRAGRGVSDPAPGPRTAMDKVAELHDLLRLAGVPGPYVLVGHSYGGLLARLFAQHYRDEVAGLVLADSMHEDQFDVFGPLFPPPAPGEPAQLTSMRAFWTTGWRDPASTAEQIDFIESRRQGHAITSLGDLPMRVLAAHTYLNSDMAPEAVRPHLQGLWNGLQQGLAGLSTRASFTSVPESGHFIQRDEPQAIVEAVRQVVAEARADC
jgi:pimeloyl-ACP methyl ester carboxylesterase